MAGVSVRTASYYGLSLVPPEYPDTAFRPLYVLEDALNTPEAAAGKLALMFFGIILSFKLRRRDRDALLGGGRKNRQRQRNARQSGEGGATHHWIEV